MNIYFIADFFVIGAIIAHFARLSGLPYARYFNLTFTKLKIQLR